MTFDFRNDGRRICDLVEADPRLAAAGVYVDCYADNDAVVYVVIAEVTGDPKRLYHELVTAPRTDDQGQATMLVDRILKTRAPR